MNDQTNAKPDNGDGQDDEQGDPNCLHCQLGKAMDAHLLARPEGPAHAMEIAEALATLIGDMLIPAPDDLRVRCYAKIVRAIAERCGFESKVTLPVDLAATPPERIH